MNDQPATQEPKSFLVPFALWAVFFLGLLLQLFSPHLRVSQGSFVIPPDAAHQGSVIDPRALIGRERIIQLSSAVFTLAGAIGLAMYYRRTLFRALSRTQQ